MRTAVTSQTPPLRTRAVNMDWTVRTVDPYGGGDYAGSDIDPRSSLGHGVGCSPYVDPGVHKLPGRGTTSVVSA
jgi:hypothetical protein